MNGFQKCGKNIKTEAYNCTRTVYMTKIDSHEVKIDQKLGGQ